MINLSSIPVVYYHSIKYRVKEDWVHPQIILKLNNFQRHLNFLKLINVKSFFMNDLYDHLSGNKKLPNNSILLHFDDGYLDNFIFAFPLLKKYNIKATIWVNPDFIDNDDSNVRPTLEDYWEGKISLADLNEYDGFLNWEEMKIMESSGLVDIQSHTMTHNRYPISDKIIDFYSPNTKIDWLYWNLFRSDKPNFLTNKKHSIPLGHPIYENQKGNIARICKEKGSLTEEIIQFVKENGEQKFFSQENWKEKLFALSDDIKHRTNNLYTYESESEYVERIKYELSESKQIIEKYLNKNVNHVCWPFGGCSEETIELAEKVGYLTSSQRDTKNIYAKPKSSRVDRIALDNPQYQNILFYPYASYKMIRYKL